jgi:alkaline phosphatase/streptomycin-6-phosphatase
MRRLGKRALAAAVLTGSLAVWGATVAAGGNDQAAHGPRNVILLIGDGMGDSEITMTRNYQVGAGGRLAMDSLPATGEYTTYSVEEFDPDKPDYVTDSSASATGIATGHKTSDKRISTSPGDDEDLPTILELAQKRGMRTGFATTGGISTATEAAFTSHVRLRGCMGPESMQKCLLDRKDRGGPGSIAEQQVDHEVDVMLGGGRAYYEQRIQSGPARGRTVLEAARAHGYEVALDAEEMQAAPPGRRLLGLFSPVGMSAEWRGERAGLSETGDPQRCQEGMRPPDQPSLVEMARTTLDRLDNPNGFLALIEGANIDTYSHSAWPCEEIGEAVEFDRAVRLVLDWVRDHPNTLVVVTADHGHAGQIVPVDVEPTALPPSRFSTLVTKENARMRISYPTTPPDGNQKHTGTQVRIAARGPFSDRVLGVTDQTDLFETMKRAIGAG